MTKDLLPTEKKLQKTSLTQRLRTDLARSEGVTAVIIILAHILDACVLYFVTTPI